MHPGTTLDAHAVAALAGDPLDETWRALDQLARAHLVHRVGPDRYGLHDLAYATGLAGSEEDEAVAGPR